MIPPHKKQFNPDRFPTVCLLILSVFLMAASNDISWPVSPIIMGFGSNGTLPVVTDSVKSPLWRGKSVYIFHPAGPEKRYPLVLFCHGFGANDPDVYRPLIDNIVSRGNVLVFSPYKTFAFDPSQKKKYRMMMKGFEAAVTGFSSVIDTTRLGIIGHSYGGGATPAIGWHCLIEKQWGASGSFLFIMAPWYSHFLTQEELEAFPQSTHLIMETFGNDNVNDPRMAIDIYNNMALPDSQKMFVQLQSDSIPGYRLIADHSVPTGPNDNHGRTDALDYYGVFKFVDALADYVFTGDTLARGIAMGNGTPGQTYMGKWPDGRAITPCIVTRSPALSNISKQYMNVWESVVNPRRFDSPSFLPENKKNRFYFGRKAFRNYWDFALQRFKSRFTEKQLPDPSGCSIPPITEGFGAHGPYSMKWDSIPHPTWKHHVVSVFYPESISFPRPVVFFCHGYSKSNPLNYLPLIMHMVSKGFIVVFSPYQNVAFDPKGVKKYSTMMAGFDAAVAKYGGKMDTSRIAYVGHSYGAGAIPAVALDGIVNRKWGENGAFLFLMAPFYSYEMDEIKLKLFPKSVIMVIEVYDQDRLLDHRMAISLFNQIGIPKDNKNFLFVYSDSCNNVVLRADHNTPKGPFDPHSEEDALDQYGIYRIFDALAAAAFDRKTHGREVALGSGALTTYMGKWANGKPVIPLYATKNPVPNHPQDYYAFHWGSRLNPLRRQIFLEK